MRFCRDRRFEARAIEDETNVALGHAHLGSVRRAKYDTRDATGDPRREDSARHGVNEFADASGADTFAAPYRRTDCDVAFEQHHRKARATRGGVTRCDQASRAAPDDENIAIFGVHGSVTRRRVAGDRSSQARTPGRAQCTFDTLCKLARLYAVRPDADGLRLVGTAARRDRMHRNNARRRQQLGGKRFAPSRATLWRCLGCVKPMPCSPIPAPLPYVPMYDFFTTLRANGHA